MSESLPRLTLGELAVRAVAAAEDARGPAVELLARGTLSPEQMTAVAEEFLAHGPAGQRTMLEWIARLRVPLGDSLLAALRPLLADRTIPYPVRVQAAARALKSLPDEPETVLTIVRPLTAGLSPLRRLERLRQLQHQLDQSHGLDAIIERREQRVKMDCPRCGRRFPREAMVRHLWHEHGLLLDGGKIRGPQRTVAELIEEHETTHDTTVLDRTSLLADTAALRGWVAASDPPGEDTAPLLAAAEERGAGLCPNCFTELPPTAASLPPPLALSAGRLAGSGYSVAIGGADWFRTLTVETPSRVLQSGPDGRRALGTRGIAMFGAAAFILLALAVALFGDRKPDVLPHVFHIELLAVIVYGMTWFLRKPAPNPSQRAVDAAWMTLARRMLKGNHGSAWLARLCRTSIGRGDALARTTVLRDVIARAAAGKTAADIQLLAAANVLFVEDGARHGRDRVAGLAALAAAGFRGDKPIEFSEHVAQCFSDRDQEPDAGDRARFRTMLLGAAFEAGLKPRDLIELWAAAPFLRRAMSVEPVHRLALLQGVWAMRPARRWERIAAAESVFDLCRIAPVVSGRVLADYPDLLLFHRPDPDTEAQLGPVLICARGIAVGGRMLADPDADIRIVKGGRSGGAELLFGPHRLPLERTPAGDLAGALREWLRFRAWALLPLLDNYLSPGSEEIARRVLAPFQRKCPRCGVIAAISVGKIGRPAS